MQNLETILEIGFAIQTQREAPKTILTNIIEHFQKDTKEKASEDIIESRSASSEEKPEFLANFESKKKEKPYSFIERAAEYFSAAKNAAYSYYSKAKSSISKVKRTLGDKILTEFEDWGVIYFKPTFKKLVRLTSMGQVYRHQQKLWLYVAKQVKQ